MTVETSNSGMDNHKSQFLTVIHQNIRQLTDFMRNELSMATSYDEEILGREVAKIISYMAFNIDPLQVDVSADATVNEFLRDSKNFRDISKYKNYRFYPLLKDNLDAVVACFGIYFITRVESIKGFSFKLPVWLQNVIGVVPQGQTVNQTLDYLDQLKNLIDTNFGPGDNGRDMPNGGIYWFYKYFKNQPYFGEPTPKKEQCSIGYFKGTWQKIIENESGLSFTTATEYFLKYYPYIKSGYYTTQNQLWIQARKDVADISSGKTVKTPASLGNEGSPIKGFFARLFGK